MRVKLLMVPLFLLLGLILFGVGVLGGGLLGGYIREALMMSGPAAEKNAPEETDPTHGLPLEITVEDVPEVPKEIQGPCPPIEEQKR